MSGRPRGTARRRAGILVALLVSFAAAPVPAEKRAPPPDPFLVPPDSIRGRVDRIALLPVNLVGSAWLPQPDTAFAPRFRERFEAAGHGVVDLDTVLTAWRGAASGAGGIFDRRTGRPDSTRVRAAAAAFLARLRDSLAVNTVWRYTILNTPAEWKDGHAKWDGVDSQIGSQGLISTLLLGEQQGAIPALSLEAELWDMTGRVLFRRRSGLAPLRRLVKDRWLVVLESTVVGDTSSTHPAADRVIGLWLERMKVVGGSSP